MTIPRLRTCAQPAHRYCCEGASCPDEDKYGQLEMTCALPSATPNGMPRCSALRGTPLVNVAQVSPEPEPEPEPEP